MSCSLPLSSVFSQARECAGQNVPEAPWARRRRTPDAGGRVFPNQFPCGLEFWATKEHICSLFYRWGNWVPERARSAPSLESSRQSRHKNLGLRIQPTAFPARHTASLIISRFAGVTRTTSCWCRCEFYCCRWINASCPIPSPFLPHMVHGDSCGPRTGRLEGGWHQHPRMVLAAAASGCSPLPLLVWAHFLSEAGTAGVQPAAQVQRCAALSWTGLEPLGVALILTPYSFENLGPSFQLDLAPF